MRTKMRKVMPVGGFSLALIILVLLGWLTYHDSVDARLATEDVDHTSVILREVEKVLSGLKDAETGQRGYVITGKEGYLQPYLHGEEEILQELRDLQELMKDRPQQQARLNEIERLAARKLTEIRQTVEIRKTKGFRAAAGQVETGIGEKLMEDIRAKVAAVEEEETRLLEERSAARKRAGRSLTEAIIGGGAVSAFLLLIAFSFLRNEIVRRIAVEEDLRKHQEGLQALVEERTRELALANSFLKEENAMRRRAEDDLKKSLDAAARSNDALDKFTAIASHDLRAPLRTVSGFVTLLAKHYEGKLDEQADRFIAHAVRGTERMSALLHDLYVYSRVGADEKPFTVVDLNASLQAAVDNLKAVIDESGAEISSDALPEVEGDDTRLVELFQNLIANAVKFRKKEECPRIHVSAHGKGDAWTITVNDNGIGIDPRHFEHIFAIFQRLHPADEYPGTGLGLALCKKIVEQHGGSIGVESTPGKGSLFYFTIGAGGKQGGPEAADRPSEAIMGRG